VAEAAGIFFSSAPCVEDLLADTVLFPVNRLSPRMEVNSARDLPCSPHMSLWEGA